MRSRLQQMAYDCGITRRGLPLLKRIDAALLPFFSHAGDPWDLCNFIRRYVGCAASEREMHQVRERAAKEKRR